MCVARVEGTPLYVPAADVAALDCDAGYTAALDVVEEGRIGNALLRGAAHVALEEVEQSEQQQDDNDPERGVPAEIQGLMSLLGSRRQGAGPEASGRPLWPPVL